MSDEDNIKSKMNQVFVNPALAAKVVDAVVFNRPQGWGRRSVAPYYKERYALEAKVVLDRMLATKEDQYYEYKYFQDKFGLGKDTLYFRVNQSIRYVIDHMDDANHTYGKLMQQVNILRKRGVGVIIRFRPECRTGVSFEPKAVEPRDTLPVWKEQLSRFLEEATPGQKFIKEKLALTPEQIEDVKASLFGLKGVISNVTSYSVKVVRIDDKAI